MHRDEPISSLDELEACLSSPPPALVQMMRHLSGDVLILGAGGKMGPTLARMARRAADEAGRQLRVIAVSRFSNADTRAQLEAAGVETLAGDLLDRAFLNRLPDAENIIHMPAFKFGASADAGRAWAINTYLPAPVCERFPHARIAAFSTGNVYPFVSPVSGGSTETCRLEPVGEYGNTALGRERIFQFFSEQHGTPVSIVRLNYACELRYGVLLDIAQQVYAEQPIDLSVGYLNAIWQGDANAMALLALDHAASPPFAINVAGPQILSVHAVARQFAHLFDRSVHFLGEEAPDALLSNASRMVRLFGEPEVSPQQMVRWIAHWLQHDGETYDKPTRFEVRDGRF